MDLQRKPVHETGQFHPSVIKSSHQFIQLLLRGNHNPNFTPAHTPHTLHQSCQIQHFLDIAGDKLPDLVNHKYQTFTGFPPFHEQFAAFGQQVRGDIRPVFCPLAPRIRRGVGFRIHFMHDPACPSDGKDNFSFFPVPISAVKLVKSLFEQLQLAFFLQCDFQLGKIQIFGISEAFEKKTVCDFRKGLIARANPTVCGNVKNDSFGGNVFGDV